MLSLFWFEVPRFLGHRERHRLATVVETSPLICRACLVPAGTVFLFITLSTVLCCIYVLSESIWTERRDCQGKLETLVHRSSPDIGRQDKAAA
jgi:hypothetical protein